MRGRVWSFLNSSWLAAATSAQGGKGAAVAQKYTPPRVGTLTPRSFTEVCVFVWPVICWSCMFVFECLCVLGVGVVCVEVVCWCLRLLVLLLVILV